MPIIYTHIHISHYLYNNEFPCLSLEDSKCTQLYLTREKMLKLFSESGITACIDPAISLESNKKILANAKEYKGFVFPAVGVHPKRTFRYSFVDEKGQKTNRILHWSDRKLLEEFASDNSVVAIGETGLDYSFKRTHQHRIIQKLWFTYQIKLAEEKGLPLILHVRDAHIDAIKILKKNKSKIRGGVCHCFTGTPGDAAQYVNLGLMLGIGCALIKESPKKKALEQTVIKTPIESLLLETDGPYVNPDCEELTNKQLQKSRNTSLVLPLVAARIAELKGITIEEVYEKTSQNAKELFKLK